MRKPKVVNRYNLTVDRCRRLTIADRSKIKEPLFWRNENIDAWCISEDIGSNADKKYGTENSYWIGIYDDDAKSYAGKLRIDFSSHGGMCGYNFNQFFDPEEMDNEIDLQTHERFLSKINYLLDEGILKI